MTRLLLALVGFTLTLVAQAGQPSPSGAPTRTKAEIEALIQKEGTTPPDWWNTTPLNFPKTIDLSMGPPPSKNWEPNKNVGHYFWSIINENPAKWKEGVKFANHLTTLNKDDKEKSGQAMRQMAHLYQDCLFDYPRAAYWWIKRGDAISDNTAYCYWRLGNKAMAMDVLKQLGADDTRHGSIIKLWADMGEFDTALKLAVEKTQTGTQDIAYLMAGDTCRMAGKFKEALAYYQKAVAADPAKSGRDLKQTVMRAQANIDAVKLFDSLDLKRIPDGAYTSLSDGYSGKVNVSVSVKAGKIADLKVTQHTEKQYYGAIIETPRQIITKQSVKGIDTFSSATITSEAIVNASAKALSGAMK